jgi:hypothetical protein
MTKSSATNLLFFSGGLWRGGVGPSENPKTIKADALVDEEPLQHDRPSVVPDRVELRIDLKHACGEFERFFRVIRNSFLSNRYLNIFVRKRMECTYPAEQVICKRSKLLYLCPFLLFLGLKRLRGLFHALDTMLVKWIVSLDSLITRAGRTMVLRCKKSR